MKEGAPGKKRDIYLLRMYGHIFVVSGNEIQYGKEGEEVYILSLAFCKKLSILGRVFLAIENREEAGTRLGHKSR